MKPRPIHLLYIVGFFVGMAILLRAILALKGYRVTSWFRSVDRNKAVGGARKSAHLIGWAADIVPASAANASALGRIFPFVLNEGDHIHVGWF